MNYKNQLFCMAICCTLLFLFSCSSSNKEEKDSTTESEMQPAGLSYTAAAEAIEHFNNGREQLDLGNINKARKHLDQAIAADPNFALAYTFRAYSGRSAKEFSEFSKLASGKAGNISAGEKFLIDINQTYLANDLEQRMNICKEFVNQFPDETMALLELAGAYSAMDNITEQRKTLVKATEVAPNDPRAYLSLSNSYIFEDPKDLKKAEEYAKKAVEVGPSYTRTHIQLGDVYRAMNQLDKALDSYSNASNLDNTDFVAVSKRGHANTFLSNYDAARQDFEQAKGLTEQKAGQIVFGALTYVYDGDYKKALAILEEEAQKMGESDLPEDQIRVGQDQCINVCSVIALHNKEKKHLSSLLEKKRETLAGIADDLNTDEATIGLDAEISLWEARLAMVEGNLDLAKEKANEYLTKMEPINNPNKTKGYHFTMGMIALEEKDYPAAIEHLQQTEPTNVFQQYYLAKAYEMNEQPEKANEIYAYLKNYNFNGVGYAVIWKELQGKKI